MVPFAHTAATQNRAFSVAGPKIWKKPTRNCEQKVFVLTSEAAYTAKLKCNEDKQKCACEKIEKKKREIQAAERKHNRFEKATALERNCNAAKKSLEKAEEEMSVK